MEGDPAVTEQPCPFCEINLARAPATFVHVSVTLPAVAVPLKVVGAAVSV